nr:MAG TPA: hypothetical protein [Caudoviricetes sp.]
MALTKTRQVFDLANINADRFYKLTREIKPLQMKTYRCILVEKTETELTFLYAYNFRKIDVDTNKIVIKVEDIEYWEIEVIE